MLNIPESDVLCEHCQSRISHSSILDHCATCPNVLRPNIEYKFVCYKCAYRTHVSRRMGHHIKRHTGEKPYKCDYCDYRCIQPYDLTKHLKIRHKDL